MSATEFWEGLKYVVGVVIGVFAGKHGEKILDWIRGFRRDRAEVEKIEAEKDEKETNIALSIAKEAREQLKESREQLKAANDEVQKMRDIISELWDKINTVTNALHEERAKNHDMEKKLNKLESDMQKNNPDGRRPQGRF